MRKIMPILALIIMTIASVSVAEAHSPNHNYPTYITPEWSGVRVSENVKMVNGSYTIHPNDEITFTRLTNVPLWYSMKVHKNGDVSFNGLLTIDYDAGEVVFNGQVVGHIYRGQIIWAHNFYLASRGYRKD